MHGRCCANYSGRKLCLARSHLIHQLQTPYVTRHPSIRCMHQRKLKMHAESSQQQVLDTNVHSSVKDNKPIDSKKPTDQQQDRKQHKKQPSNDMQNLSGNSKKPQKQKDKKGGKAKQRKNSQNPKSPKGRKENPGNRSKKYRQSQVRSLGTKTLEELAEKWMEAAQPLAWFQALSFLSELLYQRRNSDSGRWQAARDAMVDDCMQVLRNADFSDIYVKDLRDALNIMARLGIQDQIVVKQLAQQATNLSRQMNSFYVSNIMWSLGELKVTEYDTSSLVAQFIHRLDSASAKDCSMFAYACHSLGWEDPKDYLAVVSHFATLESILSLQYSNVLLAVSMRVPQPPPEIGVLLDGFLKCDDASAHKAKYFVSQSLKKWYCKEAESFEGRQITQADDSLQEILNQLISRGKIYMLNSENLEKFEDKWRQANIQQLTGYQALSFLADLVQLQQQDNLSRWKAAKQTLLGRCVPVLQRTDFSEFNLHDLQLSIYTIAKLNLGDQTIIYALAKQAINLSSQMSCQTISIVVWALSELNVVEYDISPLVARYIESINTADGQSCSMFVYACHQIGWNDPQVYLAVVSRFVKLEADNSQQYSNILWAVSQRVTQPPPETLALLEGFLKCQDQVMPQAVSNVLLAIQRWYANADDIFQFDEMIQTEDTMKRILNILCQRVVQIADRDRNNLGVVNTLWVASCFDCVERGTLKQLINIFESRMESSTPSQISMMLWALARLGYFDQLLVDRCLNLYLNSPIAKDSLSITNIINALARFQYNRAAYTWPFVELYCSIQDSSSARRAPRLLFAMSLLGMQNRPQISNEIFAAGMSTLKTMVARDCCNMIFASAELGIPDQRACMMLLERLLQMPEQWNLQGVVGAFQGLYKAGLKTMIPQTEKLLQFYIQNISDCNVKTKMIAIGVLGEWLQPTDSRMQLLVTNYISSAGSEEYVDKVLFYLERANYPHLEKVKGMLTSQEYMQTDNG